MIDARAAFAVAAGAALGGVARWMLTQTVVMRAGAGYGPLATLLINVTGSFLIGVVIEIAQTRAGVDPLWRLFLATGILGGYTTFSTFSYEAWTLATEGLAFTAAGYVAASVVLGIAAAALGIATARALHA